MNGQEAYYQDALFTTDLLAYIKRYSNYFMF